MDVDAVMVEVVESFMNSGVIGCKIGDDDNNDES